MGTVDFLDLEDKHQSKNHPALSSNEELEQIYHLLVPLTLDTDQLKASLTGVGSPLLAEEGTFIQTVPRITLTSLNRWRQMLRWGFKWGQVGSDEDCRVCSSLQKSPVF